MIKDRELKQVVDYSEGQKDAAYMILGEIVNLLNEFADNIRIIGGWVPSLLYPDSDHIGSMMMNHIIDEIKNSGYNSVLLWVFEKNTRARRFYEKHGFEFTDNTRISYDAVEVMYCKELR